MNLEKELSELQDALAMVDLFTRPRRSIDPDSMELVVKRLRAIRIRMDGNKNHKRAHVHIDYGNDFRVASYAIDTGSRLVGNLDTKYDRAAREWITGNKAKLFELWELLQTGKNAEPLAFALRGE
jgi:hypothetical protein